MLVVMGMLQSALRRNRVGCMAVVWQMVYPMICLSLSAKYWKVIDFLNL